MYLNIIRDEESDLVVLTRDSHSGFGLVTAGR